MESKFKVFIVNNKRFVIFYLLWLLAHLVLLTNGNGSGSFWPFDGVDDFGPDYGYEEFILYSISPIILYFIWLLIKTNPQKLKEE